MTTTLVSARAERSGHTRKIVAGVFALMMLVPFGAFGMDRASRRPADQAGNLLPLPPHSLPAFDALDELEAERAAVQGRHAVVAGQPQVRLLPSSIRLREGPSAAELDRGQLPQRRSDGKPAEDRAGKPERQTDRYQNQLTLEGGGVAVAFHLLLSEKEAKGGTT